MAKSTLPTNQRKPSQQWETSTEYSFASLREDETGKLFDAGRSVRRRLTSRPSSTSGGGQAIRRGIIRYAYVVIDLSRTTNDPDCDFRPFRSRAQATWQATNQFIGDFLENNPISQLGVIVTRNAQAEKLTDLSANRRAHLEAVNSLKRHRPPGGEASLQNALDLACGLLRDVPEYGFREILVLFGSLATRDPGDIFATFGKLKKFKIRVSVVGLAAELHVLRTLVDATGGVLDVARNFEHMKQLLRRHSHEAPAYDAERYNTRAEMVEMGFPLLEQDKLGSLGYRDAIHDGSYGSDSGQHHDFKLEFLECSFVCPRCKTRTADIPAICVVCSLPLVSAALLAQSHHHLFPLQVFDEVLLNSGKELASSGTIEGSDSCLGCGMKCNSTTHPEEISAVYRCPKCGGAYCCHCDVVLHDLIHNCPGCIEGEARAHRT